MEDHLFPIPSECQTCLKSCKNLPTPPKIASRIIELAKDPDFNIEDLVKLIQVDPALSIKLLRMANSPLYSHQKRVTALSKAIMLIGFNGVMSLALSFSLVNSLRQEQGTGLDHTRFWRRSLLAGSAGQALGHACGRKDFEEIFTPAFIQDVGMLALDQLDPSIYSDLDPADCLHQDIKAREHEKFGVDHNVIGGWLLSKWNFPEEIVLAVRFSDAVDNLPSNIPKDKQFFRCVSMGGAIADLYLSQLSDEGILETLDQVAMSLQLEPLIVLHVFKKTMELVKETEPLFEIEFGKEFNPDSLLQRAQDLMVMRTIKLDNTINSLSAMI